MTAIEEMTAGYRIMLPVPFHLVPLMRGDGQGGAFVILSNAKYREIY